MIDEPIPDEFGSWARLLPSPEEKKPAVEKPAEETPVAATAADSHPVIESTPPVTEATFDETATLAIVLDEAVGEESNPAAEFSELKTSETLKVSEASDKALTDEQAPVEAVAEKAEVKVAEPPVETASELKTAGPVIAEQISELKPVNEKPVSPVAMDDKVPRPFRVKLRGSLLVLVRLPNKRTIQGSFHQLSTTGGVIHFEKPLDEKLEVELIFHLKETTIRNKAQMLFPMWATQGWMQPFRFVSLVDDNRRILDEGLKSFVGDLVKGRSAGA